MKLTQILKSEFEQKDQSTALKDFDPITFSMDLQNFNESAESITEKLEELNKANSFVNSLESIVDEVKSFESIDSDKKNKIQEKLKIACESIDVDSGYFDISLESESGSVIEKIIEKIKAVLKHIVEFIKNLKDSIVKYFKDLNNVSIQREKYLKLQLETLNSFKKNNRLDSEYRVSVPYLSIGYDRTVTTEQFNIKNKDNPVTDHKTFNDCVNSIYKSNDTFIKEYNYRLNICENIKEIITLLSAYDKNIEKVDVNKDQKLSKLVEQTIRFIKDLPTVKNKTEFILVNSTYLIDLDNNSVTSSEIDYDISGLVKIFKNIKITSLNNPGTDKFFSKAMTVENLIDCLEEIIRLNSHSFIISNSFSKTCDDLIKEFEAELQFIGEATKRVTNSGSTITEQYTKLYQNFSNFLFAITQYQISSITTIQSYSNNLNSSINKLISFVNANISAYK